MGFHSGERDGAPHGKWEFTAKEQGGGLWMDSDQEEASRVRGICPHRPNRIFAADKQGDQTSPRGNRG